MKGNHARCAKCRADTGYLKPYPLLCDDCACDLEVPPGYGADRRAFALGYAAALFEVWFRDLRARHPDIDFDEA